MGPLGLGRTSQNGLQLGAVLAKTAGVGRSGPSSKAAQLSDCLSVCLELLQEKCTQKVPVGSSQQTFLQDSSLAGWCP